MPDAAFPEYAVTYSKDAKETKRKLPAELRATADTIESELAEDPHKYTDRTIRASVDGTTLIYVHPDPMIQITFQIDSNKKVLYFFHYSAPVFAPKQTIFISYSHKDKGWLEKLRTFISVLEQHGLVKFWDDTQIEAGVPWAPQIKEALDSARAALLLVSQDFLASEFINKTELPKLLDDAAKKGNKIFWLHLRPSTVFETHQQITKYQSILEDPKISLLELAEPQQQKAFVDLSKKLSKAVGIN